MITMVGIYAVGLHGLFFIDQRRSGLTLGFCYLFGAFAGIATLFMIGSNVERRKQST